MPSLRNVFPNVKDPRRVSHVDHPLLSILIIALLAMLCGAKGWEEIQEWAEVRQEWLSTFLDLPSGIPSADTTRRVFAVLDPKVFREDFQHWIQSAFESLPGLRMAIDGKTMRGSASRGLSALHIVRAFCVDNHLVLGQLACDEKSNEITAIPELLKTLALKGVLVTIDAMGCQHEIAQAIVDGGGDYLLAVKDNQPLLRQEIEAQLGSRPVPTRSSPSFHQTEDKAHGRLERRRVWTENRLAKLDLYGQWVEANTIVRIESERHTEAGVSIENRYYLSSRKLSAKEAAEAVRGHWAIENECHWSLDVTLGEDNSRICDGHAPENLSVVRSMVLAMLKKGSE
jgi:predicted transposase YbfD/YdcC